MLLAETQRAYDAVRTLEQTCSVAENGEEFAAHIWFARPNRLRVEGNDLFGGDYKLVSDGKMHWLSGIDGWRPMKDAEEAFAMIGGTAAGTGTFLPAILFRSKWGGLDLLNTARATVKTETAGGQTLLRVHAPGEIARTCWIDAKTHFIVETRAELNGKSQITAFSRPKVDAPIPATRFKR